jgi:TP901-1 family phage major tail protein
MTAQKGKDLLLKVDTNGAGSFVTVAGLRARTLAFNAATVDVTDTESVGRWRELLDGAGVKTARITGSGIFKDASTDETVRQYFFNGTVRDWRVIVPELGTVEGPFQIASLEYSGQHNGEISFDMGLESAGALEFTAAP